MTLNELLEKIETVQTEDTRLFFITRLLRENIKKASKVIDKYIFKVYLVDVDDEIRQHLYDLTIEQLEYVIKKDFEIVDYDVVSDDTEHLFTYSMKNKLMSFSDVVCNQLNNNISRINSIESILTQNEELWAYCVGFNDLENKDWIYTFRKIQPGKVAIDENISTYYARHSFSTNAIRSGASMELVSEQLGHADLKTTQNYFSGFEDDSIEDLTKKLMNF